MSIKTKFARKAVKTTAKHTAHGAASKLKRNPLRTTTLLGLGALVGAVAGFIAARATGKSDSESQPSPEFASSAATPEQGSESEATTLPPVAAEGTPPISSVPAAG